MTQKKKSLFFLASVVLLTCLLFCGQSYAQGDDRPQSRSKITDRLLELSRQKLKGASSAPAYGENPKVEVLFTAATNTNAVDFSFFNERKIEYIKSEHYIEASIDAVLIPELDSIAGIAEIDISFPATPIASAGNALMNVTDYNNNGVKGAGVKVAVVDIQFDGHQGRLAGANVKSADFTISGSPPIANSGTNGSHGTTCAGIFYDIVPEAQFHLARISGVASLENAYEWCFNNGVKIVSLSLSFGMNVVAPTGANAVINNYTDKGILTVAGAGNSGPGANTIISPATQEKALAVGSIDIDNIANWNNDVVANMSSRGPGANGSIKPDILGPASGGYTSFSTPHVAGAAAILLSIADNNICDTPAKLKSLVLSFAKPIGVSPNNNSGYGKLVLPDFSDFVSLKNGMIDTITPVESRRGTNNVSVTINGTNLLAGSTAKLVNGSSTITANSVTFNSSNRLTATFNIPSSAVVGRYDLTVSSSGYASNITKTGIFLVLGNSMAINNVSPDIGIRGTTLSLTATGTDFQSGAAIKLVSGSTVINGTGITRNGTTGITASFALPSTIANGTKFDLTVTNASGDYVTKTQAVTVHNALTVTGFTPLSANAGSVLITVTGTGFINGYSKIILKNASNESQTMTPSITSASATQITGTFTATSSGTWKVYVRAYDNGPEYASTGNMTIAASTARNLFAYEGATIEFPVISKNGAQNTAMMIIPEMTFSEDVAIDVKQQINLAPAQSHVRELRHTDIGVRINAPGKKPEKEIELRIPYGESDITGMNEDGLVISRYDEEKHVWVPLPSKVDKVKKQVTANINHLSVFAIMGTATAVKAFEDVKYYPNPLQPSKGLNYSKMHFSNIPAGTQIKIYTLLGQAVRELEADASGMAVWDGKNNAGEKAASGVYIVYMKDGSGNKKKIKIAVER